MNLSLAHVGALCVASPTCEISSGHLFLTVIAMTVFGMLRVSQAVEAICCYARRRYRPIDVRTPQRP